MLSRVFLAASLVLVASAAWSVAGAQQVEVPVIQAPSSPPSPPGRGQAPRVQQIPIGKGQIAGAITAADSGRPLRNVIVTLQGGSDIIPKAYVAGASSSPGVSGLGLTRLATTDAQGQFIFDNLPAGRFTVSASRSGFLTSNYPAPSRGSAGRTIILAADERSSIAFAMTRTSVISGFVSGDDGEPMANARIQVHRFAFVNGVRRLQTAGGATTDDRGGYRVTNLQPGEYLVSVVPNSSDLVQAERAGSERLAFEAALAARGSEPADVVMITTPAGQAEYTFASYAPTYYPGASSPAGGSTVSLAPGEDRPGVDIRAQGWRSVTIRGAVNLPPDFPFGVQVSAQPVEPEFAGMFQASIRANADGTFVLRGIPPGSYLISAQTSAAAMVSTVIMGDGTRTMMAQPPRQPQPQEMMWARATVTVDGYSAPMVSLELRPGRSVSGQVVLPAARAGAARPTQTVALQPIAPGDSFSIRVPEPVPIQADGRFRIDGVMPGRYLFRAGLLKSAMVDGVDTLDFPLEITGDRDVTGVVLTQADRLSQLTGRILQANGEPAYDYTIVVIPDDPRYWVPGSRRIAATRADVHGEYTFGTLPAGGYYLAALTNLESSAQYDPTFLRDLARAAMRVTIADGQRHVQDIRVR